MVNSSTVSKILCQSVSQIMIIAAAILLGLTLERRFENISDLNLILIAILIIVFGIILNIFAEELLGDILSGKIIKRISRYN